MTEATNLALANKARLRSEVAYCQADWIKGNACYIADIETRRSDRTLYGEWPNGWRAEMKKEAGRAAAKSLLERFLRDECKLLDGAIWLGNLNLIYELEQQP